MLYNIYYMCIVPRGHSSVVFGSPGLHSAMLGGQTISVAESSVLSSNRYEILLFEKSFPLFLSCDRVKG